MKIVNTHLNKKRKHIYQTNKQIITYLRTTVKRFFQFQFNVKAQVFMQKIVVIKKGKVYVCCAFFQFSDRKEDFTSLFFYFRVVARFFQDKLLNKNLPKIIPIAIGLIPGNHASIVKQNISITACTIPSINRNMFFSASFALTGLRLPILISTHICGELA